MKKILTITGTIILLLMAAIAILPSVINWNEYKSDITTKAKEATGRDVAINGDIKLRILPSPSITVNNLEIKNPDNFKGEQSFAMIEKIKIDAALKPLLKKKLHITGVSLVEPVIHLQKNGEQTNWNFSKSKVSVEQQNTVSQDSSFAPELSFDEIVISNGQLIYQDNGNDPKKISPISAILKGESLSGPFNLEGDLTYSKIPVDFTVAIAEIIDGNPTSVKGNLSADKNNAVVEFSGKFGGDITNKTAANVELNVNDIARLIGHVGNGTAPKLPPLFKNKVQATGLITQSNSGIDLDDLKIALGKLNVQGTATYSNDQKIGVSLSSNTVDLRGQNNNTKQPNSNIDKTTYVQTIDSIFKSTSSLIGTTIPTDLTAALELRIKKLILEDDKEISDLQVSAGIEEKIAKISNISAKLPGQSSINISATMPLKNKSIDQINANIIFKAQKTNDALNAFGVSELPSGFSPMNISTKVQVKNNSLSVNETLLEFGKNKISGLEINYTPQTSLPLVINVTGGDLDFNTLQSKQKPTNTDDIVKPSTSDPIGISQDVSRKLTGLKANLTMKLDQIILSDNLARNVTIKSRIDNQKLIIEEASIGNLGDLNSLNLKASGIIEKLSPIDGIDLKINASSDNLSRTLWAFGNKNAGDIGKANFSATINGSQDRVNLKAQGKIDQGSLMMEGVLKDLAKAPSLTAKIKADHPETSIILKNFANMQTENKKMGPFSMSAKLIASANMLKTEELAVNMGNQGTINGVIDFDKTVTPGVMNVDLNADLLPLGSLTGAKTNRVGGGQGATAAPKTWSQKPIDLSMLRNTSGSIKVNVKKLTYDAFIFENFALLANIKNSALTLEKLGANMFDGNFNVTGILTAAPKNQSHNGKLNIDIANTDVEKVFKALGSEAFGGGILSLKQSLNFVGNNQLAMMNSLNGDGSLTIDKGSFKGLDLDSIAAKIDRANSPSDFLGLIQQIKAGGTSSFEKLDAAITIKDGVISSNDIVAKSTKSQIDLSGFVSLPSQNLKLDGAVTFVEQRNLPPLGLTISGPLYAPKRQLNTDNIIRFYTQKATKELGQKALDKLFGVQTPAVSDNIPEAETPLNAPTVETENNVSVDGNTPVEKPVTPTPAPEKDVEDILKEQGEQLLRGLLGGQ